MAVRMVIRAVKLVCMVACTAVRAREPAVGPAL